MPVFGTSVFRSRSFVSYVSYSTVHCTLSCPPARMPILLPLVSQPWNSRSRPLHMVLIRFPDLRCLLHFTPRHPRHHKKQHCPPGCSHDIPCLSFILSHLISHLCGVSYCLCAHGYLLTYLGTCGPALVFY